jgi:hypothetical protein
MKTIDQFILYEQDDIGRNTALVFGRDPMPKGKDRNCEFQTLLSSGPKSTTLLWKEPASAPASSSFKARF